MKAPVVAACLLAVAVLASERAERCPLSVLRPSQWTVMIWACWCCRLGSPRRLLLQGSNIAKVENTLGHLENVTEINLSQNISSVADVCLGWLPELLSLHLEENLVWELAESCLASLPNLQEFYINHNLISFISPGAFWGLSRLTRLHLDLNQLRIINFRWFRHIPNLEVLTLAENPILQLTHMNFKPLVNLRSLVLAKINLTEVPKKTLWWDCSVRFLELC